MKTLGTTSRAQRRRSNRRIKRARSEYYGRFKGVHQWYLPALNEREIGMLARTAAQYRYSNNPRKNHNELPINEARQLQDEGWDG